MNAAEGEELRLEPVVVVAAGVAHGREKGILGGGARLPQGRGRRLQVRELEDGGGRRVLVLRLLVELEQPVVVVLMVLLLLLIGFLLRAAAAASSSYAAAAAAVRSPVVVPRIQIPRLLRLRYCCCSNARPSSLPDPITRRGVGD